MKTLMTLKNTKVIVTRSREQVSQLAHYLQLRGAEVMEFATIQISPPESFAELDRALTELASYDWLLFTSQNAVLYFQERLQYLGITMEKNSRLKIACVGAATADRVCHMGLKVDLLPTQYVAEGLISAMDARGVRNNKILFPRALEARAYVVDQLVARGCTVDLVEAYQNILPKISSAACQKIFVEGKADWITFASSSAVVNFREIVGKDHVVSYLQNIKIACIGPITAKTLQNFGLKVAAQPQRHTLQAMVDAMCSV